MLRSRTNLTALGLASGERVEIVSDHGRIPAVLEADETLRRGVASMAHGWGGLPEDGRAYEETGASPTLLIADDLREPINAMARLSSIPVHLVRVV